MTQEEVLAQLASLLIKKGGAIEADEDGLKAWYTQATAGKNGEEVYALMGHVALCLEAMHRRYRSTKLVEQFQKLLLQPMATFVSSRANAEITAARTRKTETAVNKGPATGGAFQSPSGGVGMRRGKT